MNRPAAPTIRTWWPNQLDLSVLHQNSSLSDPMGSDFSYAKVFAGLDLEALKRELGAGSTPAGGTAEGGAQ